MQLSTSFFIIDGLQTNTNSNLHRGMNEVKLRSKRSEADSNKSSFLPALRHSFGSW